MKRKFNHKSSNFLEALSLTKEEAYKVDRIMEEIKSAYKLHPSSKIIEKMSNIISKEDSFYVSCAYWFLMNILLEQLDFLSNMVETDAVKTKKEDLN